jgi:uncharacterized protein DUF3761
MREFLGMAVLMGLLVSLAGAADAQNTCNDGTYSQSNGSGTCSHHGGEAYKGR